jgi:hypothetical protein
VARSRATGCLRSSSSQGNNLLIPGDVLSTKALSLTAINFSPLILKVKECPQLEAGIGDRELNTIISGLLLRVRHERMFVDIKNAPDLIEPTRTG